MQFKNNSTFHSTQPNPWMDPTHVHLCLVSSFSSYSSETDGQTYAVQSVPRPLEGRQHTNHYFKPTSSTKVLRPLRASNSYSNVWLCRHVNGCCSDIYGLKLVFRIAALTGRPLWHCFPIWFPAVFPFHWSLDRTVRCYARNNLAAQALQQYETCFRSSPPCLLKQPVSGCFMAWVGKICTPRGWEF